MVEGVEVEVVDDDDGDASSMAIRFAARTPVAVPEGEFLLAAVVFFCTALACTCLMSD